MPSYKLSPRNTFEVRGRNFFVARVRYMDNGMQVFENFGGKATVFSGYWGCLLLPDYQRKLPCRELARRMVKAWLECNQWTPTHEQVKEIETQRGNKDMPWSWNEETYGKWHKHFHAQSVSEKWRPLFCCSYKTRDFRGNLAFYGRESPRKGIFQTRSQQPEPMPATV